MTLEVSKKNDPFLYLPQKVPHTTKTQPLLRKEIS